MRPVIRLLNVLLTLWLSCAAAAVEPAAPAWSAAEFRHELAALHTQLEAAHFNMYERRPKAEYRRLRRQLERAATDGMTRFEVEKLLRRYVAFGNVAHARIELPMADWERYRAAGGKAFPLELEVLDGAVRVLEVLPGVSGPQPGEQLLRIDGVPALKWLAGLRRHQSADNDYMAWTLLESTVPVLAWLEHGPKDAFELTLRSPTGRTRTLTVPAQSRADTPDPAPGAATATPAWDRREARMLDDGLAYLRPGPFYNTTPGAENVWDPKAFIAFIDQSFQQFLEADARTLLIDLRDNPGGDNSFSDPLLAWFADRPFRFCSRFDVRSSAAARASNGERLRLAGETIDPQSVTARYEAAYAAHPAGTVFAFAIALTQPRTGPRFEGRVYLLINRHSYSNTVFVAAMAQDYGFATILGEETSDLASTLGAMESFTLPRSGLTVGFPKARIVRPSGDSTVRGVIPDVVIPRQPAEHEDAYLERAIATLRSRVEGDAARSP